MGQRPDDFYGIALCRDHHAEQHSVGEKSFEARHSLNMMALADEFARASPKRTEIAQIKRERENG